MTFENKLTLGELLQALAVPVSLFVSFLIFRKGESNSNSKWANEYCRNQLVDCVRDGTEIEILSIELLSCPSNRDAVVERDILRGIRNLGNKLIHINRYSKEIEDDYFSGAMFKLKMDVTGHKGFKSTSVLQPQEIERIKQEINRSFEHLKNKIYRAIELLK